MTEPSKEKLKRLLYVSAIAAAVYIIYLYLKRATPDFITAALVPTAASGVTGTTPTANTLNYPAPLGPLAPGANDANQNPTAWLIGGNSYGPLNFAGAGPQDISITGPATYYITPGPATGKDKCGCSNSCGSCSQEKKTPAAAPKQPVFNFPGVAATTDMDTPEWLASLQQQSQYPNGSDTTPGAGPTSVY